MSRSGYSMTMQHRAAHVLALAAIAALMPVEETESMRPRRSGTTDEERARYRAEKIERERLNAELWERAQERARREHDAIAQPFRDDRARRKAEAFAKRQPKVNL